MFLITFPVQQLFQRSRSGYYSPIGFIVSVFLFRNRVSSKEAFEGLELGEGKLSRAVLRGPGGRKAAWLLGTWLRPGLVHG
jgi:hypothetical protein